MVTAIRAFTGDHRWLSNFYPCPVTFEGAAYPSAEHAFQAAKTMDRSARLAIAAEPSAGAAKRAGRTVVLRPDWESVKLSVMTLVLLSKFHPPGQAWPEADRHAEAAAMRPLHDLLVATGDAELVEGNYWHDNFWGDCGCPRCARIPGQNHLGLILVSVRGIFQSAAAGGAPLPPLP